MMAYNFKNHTSLLVVSVVTIMGSIFAALLLYTFVRNRPLGLTKTLFVENNHQLIQGRSQAKIYPEFRIRNGTDLPVKLGSPTTSCGCSVASLSSHVLNPGESAILVLETIPPQSGSRFIKAEIPIVSSDPNSRIVSLDMTVDGYTPTPYVETLPSSFRFGAITKETSTIVSEIITREDGVNPPITIIPKWSTKFFDVKINFLREVDFGKGVVQRAYQTTVKVVSIPTSRSIKDNILLSSSDSRLFFPPIEITAEVRNQVSVTPNRLYASLSPGDSLPTFNLFFSFNDNPVVRIDPNTETLENFAIDTITQISPNKMLIKFTLRQIPIKSSTFNISFNPIINEKLFPIIPCYIKINE